MREEIWKDVVNGFSAYAVSNLGRVKNKEKNFIAKLTVDNSTGYMVINILGDDGRRYVKCVHRLVAEAFIPNPDGKRVVNHINCDKTDNRVENLEWATDSENMKHAFQHGLCENTRVAAYEQVKRLQAMPRTDRQRESARENIIKINKRPKTDRQLSAAMKNISSPVCRERAMESHYNRHPLIKVIETGEIYRSQKELAEKLGVGDSAVCSCVKGKRPHVKGHHLEYVDDAENSTEPKSKETKPFLYDFQMEAVKQAFNGCILNGDVGTGKSRTGLFVYFKEQGGWIEGSDYIPMKNPKNLIILTTAMKRDKLEWEGELAWYRLSTRPDINYYDNEVIVDSWNNIKKYKDHKGCFFIFDEDRVKGSGAWTKTFLKIAKNNDWIMLSATTGDVWLDYWAVFVANGFYRNKTDFIDQHVNYDPRCRNYPRIVGYRNTEKLIRLRDRILIDMSVDRHTIPHHEDVYCEYDIPFYKDIMRRRWDPYRNEPIQQASSLCYILRRIVNSHESRQVKLLELLEYHPKAIIFYNFDYEREILLSLGYQDGTEIAEWSGHAHMELPDGDRWVYLVQYTAGCEGWCAITTDTMIFFSQNYSYTVMKQAEGRINRLNTRFIDLHYYHLKSRSGIDLAISKALREKKKFNETRWLNSWK